MPHLPVVVAAVLLLAVGAAGQTPETNVALPEEAGPSLVDRARSFSTQSLLLDKPIEDPPRLCSVPLLEAKPRDDVHFTMKILKPLKTDNGIFVRIPAPACETKKQNR